MLLEEALLKKLALQEEQKELAAKQEQIAAKQEKTIDQYINAISPVIETKESESNAHLEVKSEPKKRIRQMEYSKLANVIKEILKETPIMSRQQLENTLYENHGLQWKNFGDTLSTLKKGSHIRLDRLMKDGKVFYSLSK